MLSYEAGGRPVSVDARRDGLVGLFEAATMAGMCRETTRHTFEWRGAALVLTSVDVVSRIQTPPSGTTGPITCHWSAT